MRRRILNAAAGLIQKYGLKKFTVDEIALELKISKRTIYRYFRSKDEIISEYFTASVSANKAGMESAVTEQNDILEKLKAVVHTAHPYPLTVSILNEAKLFYPEQWKKVENLKTYKMEAMKKLLDEGIEENIFRSDINYAVLLRMLHEISNMFTDYDFLLQNRLKTSEAIDESLKILLYGTIKK